jgi:hypothetical protein
VRGLWIRIDETHVFLILGDADLICAMTRLQWATLNFVMDCNPYDRPKRDPSDRRKEPQ